MGNLSDEEDINRAWENMKENIKTSAKDSLGLHELKQHKPWFDQECLQFLDERKHTKMQWVQDSSQSNVDNLNTVRHEASRHFRNKKKAYMKAKIQELENSSKIKNITDLYRGVTDFNKGYQLRTNIVKYENGDMVADPYIVVARWRNYFSQLLIVRGVNDVRHTEVHTAEPPVPDPSAFDVELAIEKLKRQKSPGVVQIPAELIRAGGRTIRDEIHKLIISIWNKE